MDLDVLLTTTLLTTVVSGEAKLTQFLRVQLLNLIPSMPFNDSHHKFPKRE